MAILNLKLLITALAGSMSLVVSQPVYTGRVPCPSNSSIIGYTNTTKLNDDIVADMKYIFEGGEEPDYFHYVLCPDTEFVIAQHIGEKEAIGDSPIIPGLANSFFTCGEDGNADNNCVVTGGDFHFYFPDFVIADEVYIMGVTFANVNGASVYGDAHPASHVVFLDCHWKFNEGSATVYVHYTPDEMGGRKLAAGEPYDPKEMKEIMTEDAKALAELSSHRELQPFMKYSMSCVFVECSFENNADVIATLFNFGGAVELIDTSFVENEVAELSVFTNIGNGHAFIHENTNFKKNFARLGPVFVDNTSFLQLSRDNFGTQNMGGQCAGIFMEDDLSTCFDRQSQCTGQCCDFGDETCDLFIEEEEDETTVAEPETEAEPEVEPEVKPKIDIDTDTAPEPSPSDEASTTSATAQPFKESACGDSCKGFIVFAAIFGLALITIVAVYTMRRRKNRDTVTGPNLATVAPPELNKEID